MECRSLDKIKESTLLTKIIDQDIHPADILGSNRNQVLLKEGIDALLDNYDHETVKEVFKNLRLDLSALEQEISRRTSIKEKEAIKRKGLPTKVFEDAPSAEVKIKLAKVELQAQAISPVASQRLKAFDLIKHQKLTEAVNHLINKSKFLNQKLIDKSLEGQQAISSSKVKIIDAMSTRFRLLSHGKTPLLSETPVTIKIQDELPNKPFSKSLQEKFKTQLAAKEMSQDRIKIMRERRETASTTHSRTKSVGLISEAQIKGRFRIKSEDKPSFSSFSTAALNTMNNTVSKFGLTLQKTEDKSPKKSKETGVTSHFRTTSDLTALIRTKKTDQRRQPKLLHDIATSTSTSIFRTAIRPQESSKHTKDQVNAKTLTSIRGMSDRFSNFQKTCSTEFKTAHSNSKAAEKEIMDHSRDNGTIYEKINQTIIEPTKNVTEHQLKEFAEIRFKNKCHNLVADLYLNMMADKKKAVELIAADDDN